MSNTSPIYIAGEPFPLAPGMEQTHPFFPNRHRAVLEALVARGVLSAKAIRKASPLAMSSVAHLVSRQLMEQLASEEGLRKAMIAPEGCGDLRQMYLPPALAAAGASVAALRAAWRGGFGLHLGGGFHHASRNGAEGFCLLPDITLAIDSLRQQEKGRRLRVMVIDLDAHHANGVAADFAKDEDTYLFDVFNKDIYPKGMKPKMAAGKRIFLPSLCGDAEYLAKLGKALDGALAKFMPDVVIYNAGADVLAGDPLGKLGLSKEGLAARDEMVVGKVRQHCPRLCMMMGGGYTEGAAGAVADSLENLHRKFGLFKPQPTSRLLSPAYRAR